MMTLKFKLRVVLHHESLCAEFVTVICHNCHFLFAIYK